MQKIAKLIYHLCSIFAPIIFVFGKKSHRSNTNILYLTPFGIKYDGRVRKSVDALLAKEYKVELIKPSDALDDDVVSWHPNLTITPLGLSGSHVHFPYVLDWKVLKYLKSSTVSKIYCRDIFSGIMCVFAAKATGKQAIVDFYEWYSQTQKYDFKLQRTVPRSFWTKKLFQFYERYICKNADRLITNNISFAEGIAQGVVPLEKFTIIRNIPSSSAINKNLNLKSHLPEHLQSHKILYYIGQLSFDRKLDTIIIGMKNLPEFVLIIQGTGYLEMQKKYKHLMSDNVFFLPPIPHNEIISYASSADIGVFCCDSKDNKMFHALPNKLFEYVLAGIPQVSSSGVEIEKIFKEKNIGTLFDAYDPGSFAIAVEKMLSDETYDKIKKAVLVYREELLLENDFDKI